MSASKIIIPILMIVLTVSCSSVRQFEKSIEEDSLLNAHFYGIYIYDLDEQREVMKHSAEKRFTPASNMKILTCYTVLETFQDSIPGLLFEQLSSNTVRIQPIGEPTLLHSAFTEQPILNFLEKYDSIQIAWPKAPVDRFGAGWAWDDYPYSFQPEMSWWPIYGNTIRITDIRLLDSVALSSSFSFNKDSTNTHRRLETRNEFNVFENDFDDQPNSVPFIYSNKLFEELLKDTLNVLSVSTLNRNMAEGCSKPDTLFTHPVDTVLKKMMKPSDNLLAEQLLLLCAWNNGRNSIKDYLKYKRGDLFGDYNQPVWVDGSGLSRYNLISPKEMVTVLERMIDQFGFERIKEIFPTAGEGTLQGLYSGLEESIYAKTGTLSNNHNLSGFIITKSNRSLAFSFMNNHYTVPTSDVKSSMEEKLRWLVDNY